MCASSSSPPMCASGETSPAAISRMPAVKQATRQGGTALPSPASVRERKK